MVWVVGFVVMLFIALPLSLQTWFEQRRVMRASRKVLKALAQRVGVTFLRPVTGSAAGGVALSIASHPSYVYHALTFPDGSERGVAEGRVVVVFRDAGLDDQAVTSALDEAAADGTRAALLERITVDDGELVVAFEDLAPDGLTSAVSFVEDVFLDLERAADAEPTEASAYRGRSG